MPRVVISGQAARRFPGLGRQIDESLAVAIEGEIFQDAYLAPFKPESEIYLIPKSAADDRRAARGTTPRDPMNRRPVASPALPLIDVYGPLFGAIGPLFAHVGYRLVSI